LKDIYKTVINKFELLNLNRTKAKISQLIRTSVVFLLNLNKTKFANLSTETLK
jgi:hypothetical protein